MHSNGDYYGAISGNLSKTGVVKKKTNNNQPM